MNLYSTLQNSARKSPDATALIFRRQKTTYAELLATIDRCSTGLARLGVSRGDKLALMMRNSPEFVIAYYAAVRLGAVVVPLNFMLKPREVEFILANSGAVGIVAQATYIPAIQSAVAEMPEFRFIVSCTDAEGAIPFSEILAENISPAAAGVDASDLATILYTSGTTGKPKGAMLTHGNLMVNVESCAEALLANPDDVFLCLLPMFHTFAWTACVLLPLTEGLPTVIIESIQPFQEVAAQIIEHRVTLLIAVPPIFGAMARMPFGQGADSQLPIRICVAGAAPLPRAVKDAFESKFGISLIEGYGLTEASPVVSLNPLRGENRAGTAGVCIPGVEVKIIADDGSDATGSDVGEICVRGANVMIGYYNDPEATNEALDKDGWLHTGDIGRIQQGGYIEIVDRKKDMIIVKGFNVYSREVEDVLMMHPDVDECAVIGVPDEHGDELVKAFVAPKEEKTIDKSELFSLCRQYLAPYKMPRTIIMTKILPKNAVGKILKRELRSY